MLHLDPVEAVQAAATEATAAPTTRAMAVARRRLRQRKLLSNEADGASAVTAGVASPSEESGRGRSSSPSSEASSPPGSPPASPTVVEPASPAEEGPGTGAATPEEGPSSPSNSRPSSPRRDEDSPVALGVTAPSEVLLDQDNSTSSEDSGFDSSMAESVVVPETASSVPAVQANLSALLRADEIASAASSQPAPLSPPSASSTARPLPPVSAPVPARLPHPPPADPNRRPHHLPVHRPPSLSLNLPFQHLSSPLPSPSSHSPGTTDPCRQGVSGTGSQGVKILGGRFLLMEQVEGSNLHKCIEVATDKEYVCKVRETKKIAAGQDQMLP